MAPAQHIADRILSRSPAQAVFRATARDRLAVLAYHEVSDATRFAEQVELARRHFRPVAVSDVLEALHSRETRSKYERILSHQLTWGWWCGALAGRDAPPAA